MHNEIEIVDLQKALLGAFTRRLLASGARSLLHLVYDPAKLILLLVRKVQFPRKVASRIKAERSPPRKEMSSLEIDRRDWRNAMKMYLDSMVAVSTYATR
jgi:hypothetical protein